MSGANVNYIMFGTQISTSAGAWSDDPITSARHYICEKNDQ